MPAVKPDLMKGSATTSTAGLRASMSFAGDGVRRTNLRPKERVKVWTLVSPAFQVQGLSLGSLKDSSTANSGDHRRLSITVVYKLDDSIRTIRAAPAGPGPMLRATRMGGASMESAGGSRGMVPERAPARKGAPIQSL